MNRRTIVLSLLAWTCACANQVDPGAQNACENPPAIAYFSRHALKVGPDGAGLSDPVGFRQAVALAERLEKEGITHIYVTELLRTQQTAAPLARRIDVTPVEIPRKNPERLVEAVCDQTAGDRILVVGHRERLPAIVARLGFSHPLFDYCALYTIDFEKMEASTEYYCKNPD